MFSLLKESGGSEKIVLDDDTAFAACVALMQRLPVLAWALPASALMGLLIIVAPPGVPGFIYAGF